MTRFEQYVRDSVADLTKARRDELQAAYEAAKAKVDGKSSPPCARSRTRP